MIGSEESVHLVQYSPATENKRKHATAVHTITKLEAGKNPIELSVTNFNVMALKKKSTHITSDMKNGSLSTLTNGTIIGGINAKFLKPSRISGLNYLGKLKLPIKHGQTCFPRLGLVITLRRAGM